VKKENAELTTCEVDHDGRAITLGYLDRGGRPASLRLTFDQAQALAMTLPRLLTTALRQITRSPDTRYVFPLGDWRLESASDQRSLILSQKTTDGFEVSFSLSAGKAQGLGWALAEEAVSLGRSTAAEEDAPRPAAGRLN
jgi:hypothetical protein